MKKITSKLTKTSLVLFMILITVTFPSVYAPLVTIIGDVQANKITSTDSLINGPLVVQGATNLNNGLTVDGGPLVVLGPTTLNGNLVVAQFITSQNGLEVNGPTSLDTLTVNGFTTLQSVDVNFHIDAETVTSRGDMSVGDHLFVADTIHADGNISTSGGMSVSGKLFAGGGVDPPYVSFSAETFDTIRQYATDVDEHEKVMFFWNTDSKQFQVYYIDEDAFYTLNGDKIEE